MKLNLSGHNLTVPYLSNQTMSRHSGGRATIIRVTGHPHKTTTSEHWARQACRRGLGQIIDSVLYWYGADVLYTHRDRDKELREIEQSSFAWHTRVSGRSQIEHDTGLRLGYTVRQADRHRPETKKNARSL